MKKILVSIFAAFIVGLGAPSLAIAQCSMCKTTVESNVKNQEAGQQVIGKGLNPVQATWLGRASADNSGSPTIAVAPRIELKQEARRQQLPIPLWHL